MTDETRYTVDATETSLAVLETLVDAGKPLGVTAISEEVGVSKGVVHNHLSTLGVHDYVIKQNGQYEPSLRLLSLGGRSRDRLPVYHAAREQVENLASATGETTTLFVAEETRGIPIHIAETTDSWSPPYREGDATPLHINAPGKALLSMFPDERVDDILTETNLITPTDATISDRGELEAQLRRIRDDGISFCRREQYDDIVGIAVPIPSISGSTPAAIGICGPVSRLNGRYLEEDITGQVLSTTKSVRANLTSD